MPLLRKNAMNPQIQYLGRQINFLSVVLQVKATDNFFITNAKDQLILRQAWEWETISQ